MIRDITPQQPIEGIRRITVEDGGVGEVLRIQMFNGHTVFVDGLGLASLNGGQVSVHKPGFDPLGEDASLDGMLCGCYFDPNESENAIYGSLVESNAAAQQG